MALEPPATSRTFAMRGSIAVTCVVLAITSVIIGTDRKADALGPCASTAGSGYTMQLCITAPAEGAAVTGVVPVTVEATFTGTSPGIQRAEFSLNGAYLLTDVVSPYTFSLPSDRFVDGAYTLSATLLLRDGVQSTPASITMQLNNGVSTPPVNTKTFTPHTPAGPGVRVVATGDAAGGRPEAAAVLDQVSAMNPSMYLYLGDVYQKGTPTEFYNWYGNGGSLFHRFYGITNPVVGNHEYENGVAPGYFDYWNNVPSFYSYNAGGWHFIALNSELDGELAPGGIQYNFLQQDLAANAGTACTMVYFHHPRFSVGPQGDTPTLSAAWQLMAGAGVDVVLTGHDHSYQRWVPLDGLGNPNPAGITQFVAGAGGFGVQRFARTDSRLAAGLDLAAGDNGALRLDLNSAGASYAYVDLDGDIRDSGTVACNGVGPDNQAPTAPTNLTASSALSHADLAWGPASDNVGVSGYRIVRNNLPIATVGSGALSYRDLGLQASTAYSYNVVALDAAGNASAPSNAASIVTGPAPTSYTFTPIGDAYVSASTPNGNFGSSLNLRTDLDGGQRSFLRFDTTGTMGSITKATLRVFAETNLAAGVDAAAVTSAWTESSVTFATAPTTAAATSASTAAVAGAYFDVDVTSLVTQAGSTTVDVALLPRSNTGLRMSSRESSTAPPQLVVDVAPPTTDTTPPSSPVLAGTASTGRVELSWSAATDNVGVGGYTLRRNDVVIASPGSAELAYVDTNVVEGTTYTYTVTAFDGAGNVSSPSNAVIVTTPLPTTVIRPAILDTYIDDSVAGSSFGNATTLRADSSPLQRSLLRFSTSGINGTVASAVLRLNPLSTLAAGVDVAPINGPWSEATTNATAPAIGSPGAQSGGIVSATPLDINVTTMVKAGGNVDLALLPRSSTSVRFSSRESGTPAQLIVTYAPGPPDTTPPTAPLNLAATTSVARVDLGWGASSDAIGVDRYEVRRDGSPIASVPGTTLDFSNTNVAHGTTFTYNVVAVDAAGNVSAPATISATTPPAPTVHTRTAVADTYVASNSPTSSFGSSTSLRLDSSPLQRSLVRFDLSGVTGGLVTAKLRLYAATALSAGISVGPVTGAWSETTTDNTAPFFGAASANSGPVVTNTYLEIDVTALVASQLATGFANLGLLPRSSSSVRFFSRETAQPPQLIVVMS